MALHDAEVDAILQAIETVTTPLHERIKALESGSPAAEPRGGLEQRLTALEHSAKGLRYRGVWHDGESYAPGDFVTRGGSLWHCQIATTSCIPGGDELQTAWLLAVKRGSDANTAALEQRVRDLEREVRELRSRS